MILLEKDPTITTIFSTTKENSHLFEKNKIEIEIWDAKIAVVGHLGFRNCTK